MSSNGSGAGTAIGVATGMAGAYWTGYVAAVAIIGSLALMVTMALVAIAGAWGYFRGFWVCKKRNDITGIRILAFMPMMVGAGFIAFIALIPLRDPIVHAGRDLFVGNPDASFMLLLVSTAATIAAFLLLFFAPLATYEVAVNHRSTKKIATTAVMWAYIGAFGGFCFWGEYLYVGF